MSLKYTSDAEVTDEKLVEIMIKKEEYLPIMELLKPKLSASEVFIFKDSFFPAPTGASNSIRNE